MRRPTPLLVLPLLSSSLFASPAAPAPQDGVAQEVQSGDMRALLERYTTDRRALERFYPTPLAPRRSERLAQLDAAWRERLERVDYAALERAAAVDWQLLFQRLLRHERERAAEKERHEEMAPLLPFAAEVVALQGDHHAGRELPGRDAARRMAQLAQDVEVVHEALQEAAKAKEGAERALPTDAVIALRAAGAVDSLARVVEAWYRDHAAYEPEFGWWVEEPHAAARDALRAYEKLLREDIAGIAGEPDDPLIGDPLGRTALEDAIAGELLAYSPEELLAIGENEFAWCEARMAEAADELGFADWHDALEHVKERFVPPGEQDTLVASQARDAIAFLEQRELVTLEPMVRETWRVEMLSSERQRVLPFAAYGGQKMVVAYPTRDMEHERKEESLRGNNEHFTRIVTPHELIPGHHLQRYSAERYAPHRSAFGTPFLVEGWALHWEMLLWDEGWARGPEDRIGMLLWRMHRCARIVVSLGFHLERMTPDEMIDFLVERVGLERDGATAEVRRYVGPSYGPLYQCAYMIGGLALRALHAELVGTGRMTQREFHDEVLHQGPIPTELIRAALGAQELPRSWEPGWRFAE